MLELCFSGLLLRNLGKLTCYGYIDMLTSCSRRWKLGHTLVLELVLLRLIVQNSPANAGD